MSVEFWREFNYSAIKIENTMYDYREPWKIKIARALGTILSEAGVKDEIGPDQVIAEIPPNPEMGDIGFPMFSYAKVLRKGPPQIAQMAAEKLAKSLAEEGSPASAQAQGPYLNVKLDRAFTAKAVLEDLFSESASGAGGNDTGGGSPNGFYFGRPGTLDGKKVMVEFSSPNTNKPLHLGHLRNDVLGESVSRILASCGAEVRKVCIINDRGIHICKSMLAYKEQGQGKTPESEKVKSDRFVGDWYVSFSRALKAEG